jgi:hypothetical protein
MQILQQIATTLTTLVMILSAQVGNLKSVNPNNKNMVATGQVLGATTESLFTTQTPASLHNNDGPYEMGMRFTSAVDGQITAIRFYKDSSETGTHTGYIWDSNGNSLASVVFSGETTSGWQQQSLASALNISANTQYTVSVNTGGVYYVATDNGLSAKITNGNLSSVVGTNGVYGTSGSYPTQSWSTSNYFRDVVFTATTATLSTPTISAFSASPTSISLGNAATLSWSVSGNPTPTFSISNIGTVTGSNTSVSPTVTTTYTLTATNSQGSSNANITVTVTAAAASDTTAPSVPSSLSATVISSSQINLSWTASTDNTAVTGYSIYRGGTKIATASTNSYSDSGLSASTAYSYTVSAYDAAGNTSAQSSSVSATTQAAAVSPSTKFTTGQRVQATPGAGSNLNVRATASATGTLLGTQVNGVLGTIISGGTYVDGYYWWNVNFDSGVDGYSVENYLTAYTASIVGDFNGDGLVNSIDLSLLTSYWNQSNTTYDLNSDGIVNSLDYVIMVQNWSL